MPFPENFYFLTFLSQIYFIIRNYCVGILAASFSNVSVIKSVFRFLSVMVNAPPVGLSDLHLAVCVGGDHGRPIAAFRHWCCAERTAINTFFIVICFQHWPIFFLFFDQLNFNNVLTYFQDEF